MYYANKYWIREIKASSRYNFHVRNTFKYSLKNSPQSLFGPEEVKAGFLHVHLKNKQQRWRDDLMDWEWMKEWVEKRERTTHH